MSSEYLWPARNVAEYAYCPRLFYLMEVEGVHLPSADTERGLAVHQHAHHPTSPPGDTASDDSEPPAVVRSLVLTSDRLALTATLDLAEVSGTTAVPVEYRKGRPQYLPPSAGGQAPQVQPWPTDRIQVGLQALLLREAGYQVTRAVLYYAAQKRRLSITVDEELLAEATATLSAAKACAAGDRPLPLLNDPRCVACSLQPICLPDEVNQQQAPPLTTMSPRRIWPPHDEGAHVVVQQEGARVGVRGLTLRVTEREGQVTAEVPLATVDMVSLLGPVQISTQAIHVLADRGVPLAFFSSAGRMVALLDPLDSVSAQVRRAQVRALDNPQRSLELARALVTAKITNQRTLLMRNHPALPGQVPAELKAQLRRLASASDLDQVRGYEGQSAALYFRHFAGMINGPLGDSFQDHGRRRRPPPDPVNCCLSFAYSLLTAECTGALRLARLEPTVGAFHVSRPGRPALALDLMEPFRPLIADSLAISLLNRSELTAADFHHTAAGCTLTPAGRKTFFQAYHRRMDTEVTHPVFRYTLSYRRMLALHARLIAAWLLGETPTLAFLTTR